MFRIYNTLTRQKEEFRPLEPGKVKLYACGPTVYNYFHIGNARAFLTFDVVRRYLEYKGFEVTYVQNITDIEDKIIAQSIEENIPFSQIAEKYAQAFLEDVARLGTKPPDHQPRASEYMRQMIDFIQIQVEKGFAYASGGDVYFEVSKLPQYGQLSGKKTEDQKAGARVEENELKRHPADFTLWKASKPGEPSWDSPWGKGRPGWHTECVVMSKDLLGVPFDIHGGGTDLMFPHHENELAQALAVTGKPLANYWMHNGFLNIEGEKMSKSLKNFFTAREILDVYDAEAIRFFFLSKHYRSPIDFNRELIEESDKAVKNFYAALSDLDWLNLNQDNIIVPHSFGKYTSEFTEAMDDDFNSARALAVLFELTTKIRSDAVSTEEKLQFAKVLIELGSVLGFFQNIKSRLSKTIDPVLVKKIETLVEQRNLARQNKDWAASDRLRDELIALGAEIKDTKDGTVWKML
ncbi:MAG: cysteine--tRNA ligase [Candidatus Cloacimonadaceae bacterium]